MTIIDPRTDSSTRTDSSSRTDSDAQAENGKKEATAKVTAARQDVFDSIVARLSKQSVDKHFDAYLDVPWDEAGYEIDPTDPRWELWEGDALRTTEWF